MIALLVVGYLVGVWTACAVLRQGQDEYENGGRRRQAPVTIRSERRT